MFYDKNYMPKIPKILENTKFKKFLEALLVHTLELMIEKKNLNRTKLPVFFYAGKLILATHIQLHTIHCASTTVIYQ